MQKIFYSYYFTNCSQYGSISSILVTIRLCYFNGGSGIKYFSTSFAAKLGCAEPLSYLRSSLYAIGDFKYIYIYSRNELSISLIIIKDEATAPFSKLSNMDCNNLHWC